MAISVTWATRVINIPQADLTPVSSGLYELDVDDLRLALRALEAGEDGIAFPTTHNHTAPITFGGVTLARIVEIVNGYTITFENGTYAVRLAGGNNNIADVMNVNSVSLRSNNSAGLVQVEGSAGGSTDWTTGERAQIRHRLGIDGSASAPAATPSLATASAVVTALMAHLIESGLTYEVAFQRALALMGGLTNGAGTSLEKFFPMGQPATGTPRVQFTVNEQGERTAVTWG